jgi:hypothetical protein
LIGVFYYFQVSDALWKNIHSKLALPGDMFLTNMPGMVSSKPLLQKPEGEQGVCNMDFILMDEQSKTQETKLRNSSTLVWAHEEVISALMFLLRVHFGQS